MYSVWTTRSVNTRNVGDQPSSRIEHDAERVRSRHVARGELWVIGGHGAGANDDRVAQGPHAVYVHDIVVAGDELRIAGWRRDESVEALAEMADCHRGARRSRCKSAGTDSAAPIAASSGGSRDSHPVPGCPRKHGVGTVGGHRAQAPVLVLSEHHDAAFPIERHRPGHSRPGGCSRRNPPPPRVAGRMPPPPGKTYDSPLCHRAP